jgi:hypothetical protein
MSGRRRNPRVVMATPWDGSMEVLRDVVVGRTAGDELVVISNVPAVVGEEMSLDLMSEGARAAMRVRVLGCRPVMVNGSVRHQLHLGVVTIRQISPETGAGEA